MEDRARVLLDRPTTEREWEALVDRDGERYEVLDGKLVVSPSGTAGHNQVGADLAAILTAAVRKAGLDLPVTSDVEWRTVAADVVTQAPRGDVVVGRSLDPDTDVHDQHPILVAEVWSRRTAVSTRIACRSYWSSVGLRHYWDIQLGDTPSDAIVEVWDLQAGAFPSLRVEGDETVVIAEPIAVTFTPAGIHGWSDRESARAEAETRRAEQAEAENDAVRAENERLARVLRAHGLTDE